MPAIVTRRGRDRSGHIDRCTTTANQQVSGARKLCASSREALTPLVNERASGTVALATTLLKTFDAGLATHPLPPARTSRMRMVMRRLKSTPDFRGATIGQAVAKLL